MRARYGAVALAGEVDRVTQAGEGVRHRTLFSAACRLGELVAGGEVDETLAVSALERAARGVGLERSDAERHVRRGLERGARHPRKPSNTTGVGGVERAEVLAELVSWWERASTAPRPGRRGASELRLLAGLYLLALHAGKVELDDSLRQVAEACGLGHATVGRCRSALAPWVTVVDKGNRFTGARHRWRICLEAGAQQGAQTDTGRRPSLPGKEGLYQSARPPVMGTLTDPAHDHWGRWSGGWRLFCALDTEEGATASSLATRTGASPGGTRRNLARLRDAGLAVRDDDGHWRAVLNPQVSEGEVVDWAARRRERHRRHREAYHRWRRGWAKARERRRSVRLVDTETGEVLDASAVEVVDHREWGAQARAAA